MYLFVLKVQVHVEDDPERIFKTTEVGTKTFLVNAFHDISSDDNSCILHQSMLHRQPKHAWPACMRKNWNFSILSLLFMDMMKRRSVCV